MVLGLRRLQSHANDRWLLWSESLFITVPGKFVASARRHFFTASDVRRGRALQVHAGRVLNYYSTGASEGGGRVHVVTGS